VKNERFEVVGSVKAKGMVGVGYGQLSGLGPPKAPPFLGADLAGV